MAAVTATEPLPRRIAHLDMDAFYASVELLRYPQLQGLPVVIGGGRRACDSVLTSEGSGLPLHEIPLSAFPLLKDYTGRGVITTATYAARAFGVGSAMGLMKAARLCPQAILLPVDFDEYRRYSRRFKEIITDIAPLMEDRGVDEVYIDFTQVPGGQREGGRVLARGGRYQVNEGPDTFNRYVVIEFPTLAAQGHHPGAGLLVMHQITITGGAMGAQAARPTETREQGDKTFSQRQGAA